jgi:hypothetical protein
LCGLADITVAAGPLKRERKTAVSKVHKGEASVADPRIRCLFDPWIRDGYKIRIRIRDEQPGSYFRELRNNFLG